MIFVKAEEIEYIHEKILNELEKEVVMFPHDELGISFLNINDIKNCYSKNNLGRLVLYKNLLTADTLVTEAYTERFNLDITEMYHYGEEDFRDYMPNNCISSIYHIQFLEYLEELFLSNNVISHIEYLRGMHSLQIIDLSYNAVEDISPLLHLESLKFVNLEKNPVQNPYLIQKLEANFVVIIQ